MKKLFLILLFITLNAPIFLKAQCSIIQSQSTMTRSTAQEVGQSFIACSTGPLEKVEVMISGLSMATIDLVLKIARGNNTSTNIIHSQTVTVSAAGMLSIPINTDLVLYNGGTYTFSLVGTSGTGNIDFAIGIGNVYTGGNMLLDNVALTTTDLEFGVFIGPPPLIPTMGQWGLFIFGLLILNMGVFFVQTTAKAKRKNIFC